MSTLWQDIRYASRVLRAHPAAVAIAVLSLALGVGANSIVFSLVDGMFLRPLPVSNPASLVRIEWQSVDGRANAMAWADLQALRESGGAFADIAAQNRRGGLLGTGDDVELTLVTIVSDNYFPLLGIEPARGRLFRADLDEALEQEPAVAISDGLWRRRFGADPDLVGRTLRLNNRAFTVVGILPPSFRGLSRGIMTDIWVPVSSWRAMGNAREFEERVVGQFEPLGRLKAGVHVGAAQAQLDGSRAACDRSSGKPVALEASSSRPRANSRAVAAGGCCRPSCCRLLACSSSLPAQTWPNCSWPCQRRAGARWPFARPSAPAAVGSFASC